MAAAANEHSSAAGFVPAAYNEVITVSALADTDGKSGGLGGNRCFSWGTYDVDDTFADFSNYGSDVDVIAPGKCIWSTDARTRATGTRRGRRWRLPAVTGAVALYKASRPPGDPERGAARRSATSATSVGGPRPTRTTSTSRCSTSRRVGGARDVQRQSRRPRRSTSR